MKRSITLGEPQHFTKQAFIVGTRVGTVPGKRFFSFKKNIDPAVVAETRSVDNLRDLSYHIDAKDIFSQLRSRLCSKSVVTTLGRVHRTLTSGLRNLLRRPQLPMHLVRLDQAVLRSSPYNLSPSTNRDGRRSITITGRLRHQSTGSSMLLWG